MTEKKLPVWKVIFQKRMSICIFNGFTAGLPLYYVLQFVPYWLKKHEIDLLTIGFFSLMMIPYNFKFVWSPLLDRFVPPLGRRRGWMLITQVGVMLSIFWLATIDPTQNLNFAALGAFLVALFSATQDIALDAYRVELLDDEELGLGNSMYGGGYRAAGWIPGGLGLVLSDFLPWSAVHFGIGACMGVGIILTLVTSEAAKNISPPKSLKEAIVEPFKEFFTRSDVSGGLLLLLFLVAYKFGDVLATALQTPFFVDMQFTGTEIGLATKIIGVPSVVIGTFVGGIILYRTGTNKGLWIFGVCQMVTILGFAGLSIVGHNVPVLCVIVFLEYVASGLGSAALFAFMARATNKSFTATQFALFSSLIATSRTFAGPIAGGLIEGFSGWSGMGYTNFFYLCTVCALPGMFLLKWVAPWDEKPKPNTA